MHSESGRVCNLMIRFILIRKEMEQIKIKLV
jgi:hypothetical protein